MSEIATQPEGGQVETIPTGMQDHALVQWAYAAQQAHKIAQSLSKTSFVPRSLQGRPGDITAAILAGQELGLQPMATLRAIDVIQGTPALRAHAMRGLVQSKGHQVQLVESGEAMCMVRGRRKGEQEWQEVVWTIERAERLGLTGKDQWKKQPKTMLIARATGEICRLIASDALHAMPYASEELDGYGSPDGGAQVPRVTVREFVPGEAPAELDRSDPWYVGGSDGTEVVEDEPADLPVEDPPADPWAERPEPQDAA